MTKERFFELLQILEDSWDIFLDIDGKDIDVTFIDTEGFEPRTYTKPEEVKELQDFIDKTCEGDYYVGGEVFGYQIEVGYTSMDI